MLIGYSMAYPQASNHLRRLFLTKRQASFDEFNYLQSAPTNRPCIPVQYRRSDEISMDYLRKTFYLSYPTYVPSRPNTNSALYNSNSGYHCDQTTTYQPLWMNIANLFGIFAGSNNLQADATQNIRPVYESNDHSSGVHVSEKLEFFNLVDLKLDCPIDFP